MATSTPEPDDGTTTPPAPRHEILDTAAARLDAIETLIGFARHSIRIFDVDLSGSEWNSVARAERIAAFLRADSSATLDIVVHDTGWIERSCPRLTGLLKFYGHAITIRRTGEDAKHVMDPLVLVDDLHYLHHLHVSRPRAVLSFSEPHAAGPLVARFAEIWASAEPGISATVLGL
ncbi:MAG: hypothetical protein ABI724_05015 [Betaproteobacteria bacterium]